MNVSAADLLAVPEGTITEAGLRQNLNVGIGYLEAWLRGTGCVPLYHLMEDAATAEISRAQVWQWIRHKAPNSPTGAAIDRRAVPQGARRGAGEAQRSGSATRLMDGPLPGCGTALPRLIEAPEFPEFLTLPAYDTVIAEGG